MIKKRIFQIVHLLYFLGLFLGAHQVFTQESLNVLIFTKTNGFRHKSIPESKNQLIKWSEVQNWKIIFSEDSTDLRDQILAKVDVLVFLNTSGNILGAIEKEALINYMNRGGGFVGVHVASNTEVEWPWYRQLIGAQFKDHPQVQSARMFVDHSFRHPSVDHLGDSWEIVDEWYNFKESVLPHVNVILTLDERSYAGKKMNEVHPIAWYHYYEGGRAFYTGLGHTAEIYRDDNFRQHLINAINWAGKRLDVPGPKRWEKLLDHDLLKWDTYIGVPRDGVDMTDVPNFFKTDQETPLGFNNDPKNVFSVVGKKGNPALHITGEINGGISTKQEYRNYHLKMKFKWGEKRWVFRKGFGRDSGILYHCVGPQGTYSHAWMSSLQSQIQEGHFGDFIAMGDVTAQAHVDSIHIVKGEVRGIYNPRAELIDVGRSLKNADREKPTGHWNTLEIICMGNSSVHVINGKVVSAIENSKSTLKELPQPLLSGKIQLQSEGAEAYYKDIKIRTIQAVPGKYKKQMQ